MTTEAEPGAALREPNTEFDGPRAAGPYDLAPLLDTINQVFRTQGVNGTRAPSMGWDYTHIYHAANLQNVRVVSHHGRVVCSIGIYDTTSRTPRGPVRVGGINAVGTLPDYRRYGLATATLADCHQRMRETGRHIGLLSTGIHNWYRKLGWERAGRQFTFTLDRRSRAFLPAADDLDITEDWRHHLESIVALQNASPLGTPRDGVTFTLLAERKARRIFVARRAGTVVAYAATSGSSVRDYAGLPADVAALLRAILPTMDDSSIPTTDRSATGGHVELSVLTPATDDGLPGLLLGLGIPYSLGYLGMLKLIDPIGLLAALGVDGVHVESLGADGPYQERWRVRHGATALDLSEGELVKLFLGPERWPDFAPGIFPLTFWQWPFDRV